VEQRETNPFLKTIEKLVETGTTGAKVINFILVPLLVLAVLLAPPISLSTRVIEAGYAKLGPLGGTVRATDGAELSVPVGVLQQSVPVKFTVVPREDFQQHTAGDAAAAAAIPPNLDLKSPIYTFDLRGRALPGATAIIPIPNGIEPEELGMADIYGWNGSQWEWVPSRPVLEDDLFEARDIPLLPKALAIMATGPDRPYIAASLPSDGAIDPAAAPYLAEVNPQGLFVREDGTINGTPSLVQTPAVGRFIVIPTLRPERPDALARLLKNDLLRQRHLAAIRQLVSQNFYAGIDLDYRGLPQDDPKLQAALTSFVRQLASELHQNRRLLTITVDAPVQISEDAWRTGAFDWRALGMAADTVKIPIVATPENYLARLDTTLAYAVTQINRYKIQPILSTYCYITADGDVLEPLPYTEAMSLAGQVDVQGAPQNTVTTGAVITLTMSRLAVAGTPTWDDGAKVARFAYKDGNLVRTVWLENDLSLNYKLATALRYNVKGVAVQDLLGSKNAQALWTAVSTYVEAVQVAVTEPAPGDLGVDWQATGGQIQSVDGRTARWQAPQQEGKYLVSASLVDSPARAGSEVTGRGSNPVTINVVKPTPTPTPLPTPTPKPTPEPEREVVVAAQPAAPPPPASTVRIGSFGYGVQAHMLGNDKNAVANAIVGMGFGWLKQQVEWRDIEPAKGNYNWGGLDEVVNVCASKNIRVLFSVLRSPPWANSHPDGPPRNFNDYGDFVSALAARYKGKGMAYEIWNEQNLMREWQGHSLNAAQYVELLKIAYQRIKAADPGAIVVAGALTPTGVNDPNIAIDDRTYLQQMYNAGIKGWFDAMGAHPSGFNNPPTVDWRSYSDPSGSFKGHPSFFFKATLDDYHNIMVNNGDNKPIWVTEFGWAVGAPIPGYEYAGQNSEEKRAQWFVQAYQYGKNSGFVGVMFLWNLDFRIVAPGTEQALFGIMNPGWAATPSYAALRDMPK